MRRFYEGGPSPSSRRLASLGGREPLLIQSRSHPDLGQLDQLLPSFEFIGRFSLPETLTRIRVIF
jgi:hypothetical protein